LSRLAAHSFSRSDEIVWAAIVQMKLKSSFLMPRSMGRTRPPMILPQPNGSLIGHIGTEVAGQAPQFKPSPPPSSVVASRRGMRHQKTVAEGIGDDELGADFGIAAQPA